MSNVYTVKHRDVVTEYPHEHIKIYGKGKKERVIPISAQLAQTLESYLKLFHRGELLGVSEYLFYTVIKGKADKTTPRNVQKILTGCADLARQIDPTIPDRVYPHMFRRSRATDLYRKGLPFEMVSGLLGHEQLETTRVYTKSDPESIRRKMAQILVGTDGDQEEWSENEDFVRRMFGLSK